MRVLSPRMRLELRRARVPAVITVVTIAVALVAAYELISRENVRLPWQSSYVAHIALDSAESVAPGLDEVRWAGVVIGRITGVSLDGAQPVLTVEMDPGKLGGARLYHDAVVKLRPATPLQDMYLDIRNRGHASSGLLGPNEVLQASRTQTPVDIADVLNTFSEPIRDRLRELLDELATGLTPAGGAQLRYAFSVLTPMLQAQQQLAATLARRRVIVAGLVHDTRLLFDELAARDSDLARLLQVGSATFGAIGSEQPALERTLAELPPTVTQMRSSFGALQVTLGDVRPALTALEPTARALPAGLTALRQFAVPATPALRSLLPAVGALTPLARQLAPTASALHQAFISLNPQAPRLDRITAKVVPCELPLDKFFAWTLSVLKFGNATNLTSSPRGLTTTAGNPIVPDATLFRPTGCADGKPSPK